MLGHLLHNVHRLGGIKPAGGDGCWIRARCKYVDAQIHIDMDGGQEEEGSCVEGHLLHTAHHLDGAGFGGMRPTGGNVAGDELAVHPVQHHARDLRLGMSLLLQAPGILLRAVGVIIDQFWRDSGNMWGVLEFVSKCI